MSLLAFTLRLLPQSEKFLKKSDDIIYYRIIERLEKLKLDPFPSDAKRVIGRHEKVYRIRAGKFRILYIVFYDNNEILVTEIDKRENIYE